MTETTLTQKTISELRDLCLETDKFYLTCKIVESALLEVLERTQKIEESLQKLQIPADWPVDYQKQFWDAYPNKKAKSAAMKSLDKVAKGGKTSWKELIYGVERYKNSQTVKRGFVKHPATWLNGGCWADEERVQSAPRSFFDIAIGQ